MADLFLYIYPVSLQLPCVSLWLPCVFVAALCVLTAALCFRFHHQALVEVKILDALRRKDKDNQFNIIHMSEYFYFRNHLCITFELMG